MGSETARRPLVLAVEDSQDLLAIYEIILAEAGYDVAAAPEGRTGLDLARTLHPAVILLDMMMPDMDGLEFLRALSTVVQPAPPVVVCSGFREFEPLARERGARAFLRKPVTPDELLAAIGRALAGKDEPNDEEAGASRVAAGRAEAHRAREELWARIDLDEPSLRAMLEGVLAWLSRYQGFGTGLVDLLCNDRIFVAAGAARRSVDRELAFCSDVIDAGSSLVIADVTEHPVFAAHKAAAYWNTRFYAGCPITMRSGLVVGTVCIVDSVPRQIGVGDMRILEYLARRIAEHFEALAQGKPAAPFFEPPALFERAAVEIVLEAQLVAGVDVDIVLARLARAGDAAPLGCAAEAAMRAATSARIAAARWSADVLALVCGGARPSDTTARVLAALREAGLAPVAAGVAQCRGSGHRCATAREVIGVAEAACARAAPGCALVHAVVGARAA